MRLPAALGVAAALAGLGIATPAAARGGKTLDLRLNEVQVLGSHNSYHIQPVPNLLALYIAFDPAAVGLEYTHRPLEEQFETLGIRQIELDVWADPVGGLFSDPVGPSLGGPSIPKHYPEFDPPGLKVLHIADLDLFSTCALLTECLGMVKDWSDDHPGHLPIFILIEVKDDPPPTDPPLPWVTPLPFGPDELDDLDAEIRSVFPEDRMLTPDDVRGGHATLREAILADGWPRLREIRGQVLFALDNGGTKLDDYVAGHPSLEGRVLFTSSPPESPEAAFAKLNDPLGDFRDIKKAVSHGMIVRTRADADTVEARTGETKPRDKALKSGAQFVSTDYEEVSPFGTGYIVELPGSGPGRCNPVSAPKNCRDEALLEDSEGLRPLFGNKLQVRDPAGDATRRRISVLAKDVRIETPLPGGLDDPTTAGATLELKNPDTLETATFALPAGSGWEGLGEPAGVDGYAYRDDAGLSGPCSLLEVRQGATLRALCSGDAIPFSLDEAGQAQLDVTLRLGDGALHCLHFGGKIVRDVPGLFVARAAPAAECAP